MSELKKIYEIGYHVLPNLSSEELSKVVDGIKANLAKFESEIISEQHPANMHLSYDIVKEIDNKNRKFSESFFGWVKFEMDPSKVEALGEMMDKNANILRYILIKTVRENTLAGIKLAPRGGSRRSSNESENVAPIDETVVDKKIDEMIDEEALDADLK